MATVARLHSDDRYNRLTTGLPRLTGHLAQSVEQYIRLHRNQFGPVTDPAGSPSRRGRPIPRPARPVPPADRARSNNDSSRWQYVRSARAVRPLQQR